MTLNGVMTRTLRYFTEVGEPVFEHITASARIEVIDQKSASVTHRAVKFACVTKCQGFQRYLLLIYRLSFTLPLLSI